jgi:hypothetical protein
MREGFPRQKHIRRYADDLAVAVRYNDNKLDGTVFAFVVTKPLCTESA